MESERKKTYIKHQTLGFYIKGHYKGYLDIHQFNN